MLTDLRARIRALFDRRAVERELDDELSFHFDQQLQRFVESGLDRDEAVRRTRRAFGGADQIKEECRDARGVGAVDEVWRDAVYGLRMLWRRRLSSAAAILTLAVGIGLNAAVFSVVDWVLLRPLPYPSPDELVKVFTAGSSPVTPPASLTYSEFDRFAHTASFRASAAFSTATRVIGGDGLEPAHVVLARTAGDLFSTLGVYPKIGRAFTAIEARAGAPVLVISEDLWRRRLSADPQAIGRPVTIDGQAHIVIGVMPANRGYPKDVDLWRPLTAAERGDDDREQLMIARLADDASSQRASVEVGQLASAQSGGTRTAWAEDLQRIEVAGVRAALTGLFAASGLILLIACGNVAALVGAHSADRAAELAVRGALGASRARLVQQVLIETVLLAMAGGAAGLFLGGWALEVLVSLAPVDVPRLSEVTLDARVIAAGLMTTVVVGLAVGVMPALHVSQLDGRASLGAVVATARASRRTNGRRVLVAAQTAVAVVLTVGAVLLGRSLQHLLTIDHGFEPNRLVAVDLYLRGAVTAETRRLYRELVASAQSVAGVRSAAVALRQPHQLAGIRIGVGVVGVTTEESTTVVLRPVSTRYFETIGTALTTGRDFTSSDRETAPPVAIVNGAFVRTVLHGRRALGMRLKTSLVDGELTIVGEVPDMTPAGEADRPALYVAAEQMAFGGGALLVRTDVAPPLVLPALTARLRATASQLALDRIHEVADDLEAGRAITRFNTELAGAFAALALLLSAIGVYGLTAGEVAGRWRELAVRLALGASSREALWTAMRPSINAVGAGIGLGLGGAVAAARAMSSLLHGVSPADPATLVVVPTLLAMIGLVAASLAAAQVVRTEPAATLRGD
jgi:putative ABC transport system permease protein